MDLLLLPHLDIHSAPMVATMRGVLRNRTRGILGSSGVVLGLWACGPSEPVESLPLCSAAIRAADAVAVPGTGTLALAGLCLSRQAGDAASAQGELTTAMAPTMLGYRVVGPAATLRLAAPLSAKGLDVTLPIGEWPVLEGEPVSLTMLKRHAVIVMYSGAVRDPAQAAAAVHLAPVENLTVAGSPGAAQVRFHLPGHGVRPLSAPGVLGDVATFAVAFPTELAKKKRYTYRAVAGVSMGGIGASMYFFGRPDWFDSIGVMGADPGPDLTYSQSFIREYFFGGFCKPGDAGCRAARAPLAGQGELTGTFDAMPIQTGEGIGLTLGRSLYLRANRDLVRALGNWALYNPADPYLPPGVPASILSQSPAQACKNPVVLAGLASAPTGKPFYDGRFNPEGMFDVITFCDGGEKDGQRGVYDDTKEQTDPAQILLAVDRNGNGKRDLGEPVLIQSSEPWDDVGTDGKQSAQEPGYDAVKNPDPSGDDYHYLLNPGGTEGNWRYDAGEPYVDAGLDGRLGKGCEIDEGKPGCFDHGEGNQKFDQNPGLARWLALDPRTAIQPMMGPGAALRDKSIYYDAGIRDFFNAQVSTSSLFGALAQVGHGVQLFGGFPALLGKHPADESKIDISAVPWSALGEKLYVRYGNPDLSDAEAAATGNGRHAGSVQQVVQRAVSLFGFLLSRWPGGDYTVQSGDDPRLLPKGQELTLKNGRKSPYSIVLPPGYFEPQNQGLTYPVVYFGHGYGMSPEDMGRQIGSLIHGFMSDPDEKKRLPKAVLVFLDGVCRPGGSVPKGPLDVQGDLCEEGGFYTDHPTGQYKGQQLLDELDAHLRKTVRLKAPSDETVRP